jgi:GH18 family chitinase
MSDNRSSKEVSRRDFLRTAGLVTAVAAAGIVTDGCGRQPQTQRQPSTPPALEVYLPAWLNNEQYSKLQDLDLHNVGRFIVAFALPKPGGGLAMPAHNRGLKKVLAANDSHAKVGLAVGGASANPQGWTAALHNPRQFITDARRAVETLGADRLDIDFEEPTTAQAGVPLTRFTHQLRDGLQSDVSISMAVAANINSVPSIAGYQFGTGGLQEAVNMFHVMTYDETGPWVQPAGVVGSGQWTIDSISQWVSRVGNANQISVGYPSYGYEYMGARHAGENYQVGNSVLYDQLPPSEIHDDPKTLTSYAIVDGNWTTVLSPAMIKATQARIASEYPDIGGAFLWSAEGLVQGDIQALEPNAA